MYQEELESSNLAKFLNDYDYVFVDTCSLMEDSFPLFMDRLAASKEYWKEELEVIVLGECLEELKKHSKEKSKEHLSSRVAATRALKIIKHDRWRSKTLTITKCEGDSFADNAIFTKVSSLRIHNKILVITQDKTLTTDLLKLNRLDSQKGRYLSVYRLNKQSELEKNPGENGDKASNKKHDASSFQKVEKDTQSQPLTKAQKTLIQEDDKLIKNLENQKYKVKNKLNDIDAQILRINRISKDALSAIKLHFSKDDLLKKKAELLVSAKKDKKNEKKEFKKEEKLNKEEKAKVIVTSGKKPSEAFKRLALNYHSIVRDPTVTYVAAVHGDLDLTTDDLNAVDKMASNKQTFSFTKHNVVYNFVRGSEYSVSCEMINSVKEKKPIKPQEVKEQIQPKKVEKAPQQPDEFSKKKVRIVKVNGSVSGGSSSAIPEGIILVVGEARKKTSTSKKEERVPVMKKHGSDYAKLLKEALNADRILNANIYNPNYPKDKLLQDIKKQKERLKKVESKDLKEFQLKLADLDKFERNKKK